MAWHRWRPRLRWNAPNVAREEKPRSPQPNRPATSLFLWPGSSPSFGVTRFSSFAASLIPYKFCRQTHILVTLPPFFAQPAPVSPTRRGDHRNSKGETSSILRNSGGWFVEYSPSTLTSTNPIWPRPAPGFWWRLKRDPERERRCSKSFGYGLRSRRWTVARPTESELLIIVTRSGGISIVKGRNLVTAPRIRTVKGRAGCTWQNSSRSLKQFLENEHLREAMNLKS